MKVTILGATGSIGVNTLDVIARHPDRFQVFALTGHSRLALLADQCHRFNPDYAVVSSPEAAGELEKMLADAGCAARVLYGEQGLCEVAADPAVDTVVAAIVGAAGLRPTMAAVQAGKRVLLANKESLVMAGDLFMQAVAESGALLLPIDSEHNAIFQCLPDSHGKPRGSGVSKILLSASGGPFRTIPLEQLETVTPEQACAHPNWDMGRKISVDSATMMNKGLELVEACHLFAVGPDKVEVLIHPQSIVHSLVEYADGSVLAQLGKPDMRTPIAYGLAWPERLASGVASLDLAKVGSLEFAVPELARFPCLGLAMSAAEQGSSAPAILNAANEIAVAAFLDGKIGFTDIARVVDTVLAQAEITEPACLDDVQNVDAQSRRKAEAVIFRQVN